MEYDKKFQNFINFVFYLLEYEIEATEYFLGNRKKKQFFKIFLKLLTKQKPIALSL